MTTNGQIRRPPVETSDNKHFWEGLRDRRVVLQECLDCGYVRFPPMPGCPSCGSPSWAARDATGRGSVYSYVRAHMAIPPLEPDEVPVTYVTVELDEGCRVVARLLGADTPRINQRVVAMLVDRGSWTELAFGAEEPVVTPSTSGAGAGTTHG